MAAKVRQQPVTDHDVLAVEEQVNFCLARDSVLSSLQICHPIVVDQYDICALVKSKAVKKLKVALLQVFCESLELQVPSPQVRRKAPYVALLQKLVSSCSCSAIIVWTRGAFLPLVTSPYCTLESWNLYLNLCSLVYFCACPVYSLRALLPWNRCSKLLIFFCQTKPL